MFTYKKCLVSYYDNYGMPIEDKDIATYCQLEKKDGDSFRTLWTWDRFENKGFPLNVFDAYSMYLAAIADKNINL